MRLQIAVLCYRDCFLGVITVCLGTVPRRQFFFQGLNNRASPVGGAECCQVSFFGSWLTNQNDNETPGTRWYNHIKYSK